MDSSWYEIEEFCAAAKRNDTAALQLTLDMQGSYIANSADSAGDTALTWAAWYGHVESMALLLDYGADINLKGVRGRTALAWAVEGNKKEAVALLMSRGADINVKDDDGKTPLQSARDKGFTEIGDLIEGVTAAQKAEIRRKQEEEAGKTLAAQRLQELKKLKPPKIKGF
ncbi:MAG: ankyrin repeat domain-containing protein [Alphaproteobacteria bacterium]